MNLNRTFFAPAKIFVLTWSFALLAAYFGPKEEVYFYHDVIPVTLTLQGITWIFIATAVFISGTLYANRRRLTIFVSEDYILKVDVSHNTYDGAIRWGLKLSRYFSYIICIGIITMLLYWTLTAVREIGNIVTFVELVHREWHTIRRLWPSKKPFPGARLLYTGLISTTIVSAAAIGLAQQQKRVHITRDYLYWIILLISSLIPLMLLPLLVSQRLLLATALVGSIVSYTMANTSGVPIKYLASGGLVGFSVWVTQETLRTNLTFATVIDSIENGIVRLLFYFSNNVGNLNRAITFSSERSYGFESFNFIFRYLFIDEKIRSQYLGAFSDEIGSYLAGGTVTGLGAPYVDFGVLGLVIIFIWGYLSQSLYISSKNSLLAGQLYGLVAASIVLSWQAPVWAEPYFWFNLILIVMLVWLLPAIYIKHYRKRLVDTEKTPKK